jgi:dTDP-4-amino-4,6-dideoxygalactose transaminase
MQTLEQVSTNIPLVDLGSQYRSIKSEVDAAVAMVIDQAAFIGGPVLRQFERDFAQYCGVRHCVGVANGTDALFVALKVLEIGRGDEVITVANSFVATAEAIRMAGAQVVFVDIDPETCLIDVDRIEEKITPRTKAIIPVHLYGQPADMLAIRKLATRHSLAVIGDAAQAHGATVGGAPIATLADITAFSFYPGKNLGAYGDAGAVVTDNEAWATRARMFANHGRANKYDHEFEGVNSRLDSLQAAVLSVKLRHIEQWTERRRCVAGWYQDALRGLNVRPVRERADVRSVYHLYVVRVPAGSRRRLQEHLAANGVSTGIHYPIAVPYLKAYESLGHTPADFPHSLHASSEILTLPMFPELTFDQVAFIADQIAGARI